ncbi:MAG: cytochrome c3 family protein [Betaproteobacteria bacterium]|nr:cytochrome c3 family protein [Betaproteobacteria bacterium]
MFTTMAADTALAQISGTKHNLGTGNAGATATTAHLTAGTDEVCVFCHTPHGSQVGTAPLWNKNLPSTTYTLYGATGGESGTLDGQVLTVGSVSQACLSCHDGTQAMDNMINAPGSGGFSAGGARPAGYTWTTYVGATGQMPAGITNLSADLRNDHPIGVEYCGGGITEAAGTCKDPDFKAVSRATINGLVQFWVDTAVAGTREKADMILYRRTFSAGVSPSVECGSCHDPHSSNTTFLRVANTGSALCLSCHVK